MNERILVVDSDPTEAKEILSALENLGFHDKLTAGSGREAVQKCGEAAPSLAFINASLSGEMNALTAACAIRARINIPLIFYNRGNETLPADHTGSGIITCIGRPPDVEKLRATIEKTLRNDPGAPEQGTFCNAAGCRLDNETLGDSYSMRIRESSSAVRADADVKFRGDMLDSLDEGLWVTDSNDTLVYADRLMNDLAGIDCVHDLGRNVLSGFLDRRFAGFSSYYNRAKGTLKPVNVAIAGDGGDTVCTEIRFCPRIRNGTFSGMTGMVRKIDVKGKGPEIHTAEDFTESFLEAAPVIIVILDRQGRIVRVNSFLEETTGYRQEELMGKDWFDTFLEESSREKNRKYFLRALTEISARGYIDRIVVRDGGYRVIEWYHRALKNRQNETIGLMAIGLDLDDRLKTHNALKKSEDNYRELVENIHDIIYEVNRSGTFVYISPPIKRLSGYAPEELIGKPFIDFVHPEDVPRVAAAYPRAMAGPMEPMECRIMTRGCGIKWVRISGKTIGSENKPGGLRGMITDITEWKNQEENLRIKENAIASAISAMAIADLEGKLVYVNPAFLRILGYEDGAPVLKSCITRFWRRPDAVEKVRRLLFEHGSWSGEVEAVRRDGSTLSVHLLVSLVRDDRGNPVHIMGSFIDVTEQKKAETGLKESELRYRSFVENFQGIAYRGTMEFVPLFFHGAVEDITGYTEQEFISGVPRWDQVIHPEDLTDQFYENAIRLRTVPGLGFEREYRIVRRDGTVRWVREYIRNISDEQGKPAWVQGSIHDITHRKLAEEKLSLSLMEKEILLREVHHRVKNNFQIIISLLRLQQRNIREPALVAVFNEAAGRIKTMGAVHEILYQSENMAVVDFDLYLKKIVGNIFGSVSTGGRVGLLMDLDKLKISIEQAIPCGLLVNEIITNTLKHAFPESFRGELKSEEPTVTVSLAYSGTTVILRIADNGIGIPDNALNAPTASIGLALIPLFVEQLGGEVKTDWSKGTGYTITFQNKLVSRERTPDVRK